MGKRTLWTGVILGAAVGGMISLLNEDARNYAKTTATASLENMTFYSKNPEVAIKEIKAKVTDLGDVLSESTNNAINAIEQVENTVVKVTKPKQIEK